jgi:hypothetical protein
MCPRPQRGQGWRKGGEYFLKTGFLQSKKSIIFKKTVIPFPRAIILKASGALPPPDATREKQTILVIQEIVAD